MIRYSPNEKINAKIHKLLKLGVPPIPVAPKLDPKHPDGHRVESPEYKYRPDKPEFVSCNGERVKVSGDYCKFTTTAVGCEMAPVRGKFVRVDSSTLSPTPLFTGKNPSYLGWDGKHQKLNHGQFQTRMPTDQEIKKWFANPNTGIGTLGGHNGIVWIDFDAKNYPTQEDCDRDVQALQDRIGKPTLTERTGSGGYRVAVIPRVKPTFTNFSTEQGGKHLGEALFKGRYTVLAPSKHPNGNYYRELCDANPVEVDSLEVIGIYPSKDEAENQERAEKKKRKGSSDRTDYRQDWLDSGVDPDITDLNVEAIAGADLFDFLYPNPQRINTGRLNAKYLRLWERCVDFDNTPLSHGWICNGRVKILQGPILAPDYKGKVNKYRNPEGGKAPITLLKVPLHIWAMVAQRYGVAMPERITITEDGEAKGFWEWVFKKSIPIVITEGEKKTGLLLTLGYAAISIPGISMGYRATEKNSKGFATARELHPDLLPFDDGREVTIAFDYRPGDWFKSKEWKAADTLGRQFNKSKILVAQLPGPEKGIDDFAIAGGDVDRVLGAALPVAKIRAKELWTLSHFVAWYCNQKYLQGLPIPYAGLAFIKSAKNTGKTYNLKGITQKAAHEGRKVLLLTHRIVLGRAICNEVGLTWIEDRFASEEDKLESELLGYGLCVDSLHPNSQAKFNPENWEGAIVILDELEQVIWHLLNSSTCQSDRVAILDTFKSLINVVLESGGLILGQDADLTDISINFILGLKEGDKPQPWVAVNDYKPQKPWHITNYDTVSGKGQKDDPTGLLRNAANHVNDGGKIWVQVDGQKAKSKYGTTNLEKYFAKQCPGARILRIDQATVGNPEHPAYQCSAHINEIAKNYDIVICSPSLATGVSVDLRSHFTLVCGIFQGACSDNEVRQALARVREPVPRWIWIRQRAVAQIGNGSSSWFAVANSKTKDCRYNLQLLKDYEFELEDNFDPITFRTWAKMAARINASAWDYRNAATEGLEAEGHLINSFKETDRHASTVLKEIRQDSQIEHGEFVTAAESIDWKEREALAKKRSKTDEERYAEEKFDLKERYGVDVTPELCQLSEDGWYPKIQLHYYLTHNLEFLKMRDWKHIEGHRHRGNGKLCPQDVRLLQLKVQIHLALGTLKFSAPDGEWTKESPEVVEFVAKALKVARDIKDICGISVSQERANNDPIGLINTFLKQMGLKLKGEQRRKGSERERVYKFGGTAKVNVYRRGCDKTIPEPEGLREQVFALWETRDTEALQVWESEMACTASGLAVTAPSVTAPSDSLENVTAPSKNLDIENAVTKSSATPIEKMWGVAHELAEVAAWVAEGAIEVATNSLRQVIKSFGIDKVFEALDSLPEHQRLAIEGIG